MNSFMKFVTNLMFVVFGLGPDVVTVTSGSAGNAGSTAAELITYMSARLLEVAEFNTILDQFGKFIAERKLALNTLESRQANQRQADKGTIQILAGFFAGEGHVGIRKSAKKSKCPSVVVEVGNTEVVWCNLFQQHFGGYIRLYFPKRAKALPYYHWTLKDEQAALFLQTIYPFLIGEKRQQAELAIRVATIKLCRPSKGGHFNDEQLEVMERLEFNLRDLRRAAAETKRASAQPVRNDSPTLPAMVD